MILSPTSTIAASFHISGYDLTSRVMEVNIQKFQYFVLDTILQYNLDSLHNLGAGETLNRERILSSDCDYWIGVWNWNDVILSVTKHKIYHYPPPATEQQI